MFLLNKYLICLIFVLSLTVQPISLSTAKTPDNSRLDEVTTIDSLTSFEEEKLDLYQIYNNFSTFLGGSSNEESY